MIVTVTANPSIDITMAVPARPNGDVQRARWVLVEPSGKGVNVAVALRRMGSDPTAVLPLGRGAAADRAPVSAPLEPMLAALGVRYVAVEVHGHVRTNVTLVEDDGTTSKVNELGAPLTADEATAVVEAGLTHSRPGDWITWCGSLPAGFTGERLGQAVAQARADGRLVAVDTSQSALTHVLGRPGDELPHLIKPNAEELADVAGRGFTALGDVVDAAVALVERGVHTVLVTLGGDGALLVDRDGARHGEAPAAHVVNTAGAGDAFLAGYLWADGADGADGIDAASTDARLAWALRFGAAAVGQPGTLFRPPETFSPARITPVDRSRPLTSPVPAPRRTEPAG